MVVIKRLVLLMACLVGGFGLKAQSTHRTEVFAGLSVPEYFHAGIRFQIHQFQPGISFGTFPSGLSNSINNTFSFDVNYHFEGKSKYSSFKPWFINAGYMLYKYENNDFVATEDLLKIRVGNKMNVKDRFGVEIDGGVGILTRHVVKQNKSGKTYVIVPFTPCIGIRLFYNIGA